MICLEILSTKHITVIDLGGEKYDHLKKYWKDIK